MWSYEWRRVLSGVGGDVCVLAGGTREAAAVAAAAAATDADDCVHRR